MGPMSATVICFINQKGGCGKSSTCFHLAGYFAQLGQRVLLIDADPQGSLSQGFFGSALIENLSVGETLAALFDDNRLCTSAAQLTAPTAFERISVMRANQTLARYNVPEPEHAGLKQFVLQSCVRELVGFDIVLIDCPPNLYQSSWNALLAADFVVIPVPPEDFGTQGLRAVHQAIDSARILNPALELLGHIVTRADRRLIVHRAYERMLRSVYGGAVLESVIPEASAFKVALAHRQPVTHHARLSRATQVIYGLGQELMARMSRRGAQRRMA